MSDIKLTMLVNSINKLVANISETSEIQTSSKDSTSYIVGVVLGTLAKLPAEKPGNKKVYYTAEVLPSIHGVINAIIENVILNIDIVMDTIFKVWCSRYELLHPTIFNVRPLFRYLEAAEGGSDLYRLLNGDNNDVLSETINNFAVYLESLEVNK